MIFFFLKMLPYLFAWQLYLRRYCRFSEGDIEVRRNVRFIVGAKCLTPMTINYCYWNVLSGGSIVFLCITTYFVRWYFSFSRHVEI